MLRDGVYVLPERPDLQEFSPASRPRSRTRGAARTCCSWSRATRPRRRRYGRWSIGRRTTRRSWTRSAARGRSSCGGIRPPSGVRAGAPSAIRRHRRDRLLSRGDQGAGRGRPAGGGGGRDGDPQPRRAPRPAWAHSSARPGLYRRRVWATRKAPWVDRLACAWLIKRHIDPAASFVWLETPADLPTQAVGFDFDGAPFTHVESRVTFEVFLKSFDLEGDGALRRLGDLVHYLDVGGFRSPTPPGWRRCSPGPSNTAATTISS